MSGEERTILVVHGDKRTQRTVHRILGGTCNHLVFNLEPGARTEVIALIDVRFRPAELTNAVCSFGVFAA